MTDWVAESGYGRLNAAVAHARLESPPAVYATAGAVCLELDLTDARVRIGLSPQDARALAHKLIAYAERAE